MNTFDTTYILSAERPNLTDAANFDNTKELERKLKLYGVAFKRALGCFHNRREVNFIVCGSSESTIIDLIREFRQDCALVLDSRRNASFIDRDGILTSAGKFKVVPEDVALRQKSWTFDKVTNQYFIIE